MSYRMPYPFEEGKHYEVDEKTGCWNWIRYRHRSGYGVLRSGVRAHRLSYESYHDIVIPKGLYCCHRCDNPSCVNPDHLFLGTQLDNVRDMMNKGRANHPEKFTTTALMLYGRLNPGWTYSQAAEFFGVHKQTVFRRVKNNRQVDFGR